MKACFVTSTGTGIGKTFVTAALTHQLRAAGKSVRAVKPIVTGLESEPFEQSDPGVLLAAMEKAPGAQALDWISPIRYAAPLAPAMAAEQEGKTLDFGALVAVCEEALRGPEDVVLIEGVGGVMVPLVGALTVLDWMAALGLPVILVAGSYLGTLSHTLTALEVLRARALACAGVVISESPASTVALDGTVKQLRAFVGDTPVLALPRAQDWRDAAPLGEALLERMTPLNRPNRT